MKLKQQLALYLCTFYLISVIGIALSMHFCGGKLASVAVNTNQTACKICKTEPVDKKDDGCCKNTKVDVKVKDSHQAESSLKLPKLFSLTALLPSRIQDVVTNLTATCLEKITYREPPKPKGVAIHIVNCVFRN